MTDQNHRLMLLQSLVDKPPDNLDSVLVHPAETLVEDEQRGALGECAEEEDEGLFAGSEGGEIPGKELGGEGGMGEGGEEGGDSGGLGRSSLAVGVDGLEAGDDGLWRARSVGREGEKKRSGTDLERCQSIATVLSREGIVDLWRDVTDLFLYCEVEQYKHRHEELWGGKVCRLCEVACRPRGLPKR